MTLKHHLRVVIGQKPRLGEVVFFFMTLKHHLYIGRDRSKTTTWLGCFLSSEEPTERAPAAVSHAPAVRLVRLRLEHMAVHRIRATAATSQRGCDCRHGRLLRREPRALRVRLLCYSAR